MTDTKTDEKATRPNELRRMADGMSEGYGLGDLELGWTDTISLLRGSADEIETLNALIGQLMQIAHGNALFNGGFGDRDPVVGFSLIMAEWNRICAENDNYETGIERLKELVDELSEKTSFLQAGCLNLSRDDLIELVADPHRNRVVLKGVSRSQVDMVLSWIEEKR